MTCAIVKTVHTEAINHDPAITFIQTGSEIPGRPSMGAWLSYGLGSENNNLPAFVVLHLACRSGANDAGPVHAALGLRLPADATSGRELRVARRPGALPVQPGGRRQRRRRRGCSTAWPS